MKGVLGIIGAGDLGRHIAHYAAISDEFSKIIFFDDIQNKDTEFSFGRVVGTTHEISKYIDNGFLQHLCIGIGYHHFQIRKKFFDDFSELIDFPNIIHKSVYIDNTCQLGKGNVFLPGCIVDKDCTIGNNIFFNPGCIIAHDNIIHDHSFFGPGVTTSGFVEIGSSCFLGTKSIIIDNLKINDNIKLGAGTVVTKNLIKNGIYFGIPAKNKILDID